MIGNKKEYSRFIKEKIYEMHESFFAYFNNCVEFDEGGYYEISDILDKNRIILPMEVYDVFRNFFDDFYKDYLVPESVSPVRYEKKVDLSEIEKKAEESVPAQIIKNGLFDGFRIKNMYEIISIEYIRPIFVE